MPEKKVSSDKANQSLHFYELILHNLHLELDLIGAHLTSQCSHLEVLLLSRFWSERWDFIFFGTVFFQFLSNCLWPWCEALVSFETKYCYSILKYLCPNVSTTPIMTMGCRQRLHPSVVQLKGKHCHKTHCRIGLVDTFRATLALPQCSTWELPVSI